ncbi:MAG TPA: type II CAAX endopeptidase family protein [Thermoanaerobaculaceae bacterium]|nr:type II CAAX endopeptidase family protein [Thermoanaerobaculaceae bacterium]
MDRFTRGERLILAVAIVAAAACGTFAWMNFTRAFPEAHLSFAVNRSTSEPVAKAFLSQHAPAAAAALAGRRHAAIFRVDDDAKVYLERELGLDRMGSLLEKREVRLWSWAHRWFRPVDKEEVRVAVTPEGEVVGFAHAVPEEAAGPSLDEGAARAVAEKLLSSGFGLDPAKLTFIESKREDRPHRRDWTFTYERSGWKAKDATYRMQVQVHGDEAASYGEYLKVPDAWTQAYQRLRAANNTTALVADLGLILTLLAAVFVIFREGRRGNVRWRIVMLFTSVAFGLFFLLSLNDLPIAAYGFDTTGTYGAFLARQVLSGLAAAGLQSLSIFLVVAAGEPLFRARFPQHLRVTALFEKAGWRSKKVAFGLILGYCLAAVFLAYQVAFYLVGSKFGAWNPAEVPFDNLLNTWFPWLAVLFIGFYPAVNEEFMSRVFSIPLVAKLTRSRVASIVIPAMIWGFAHANYPAQPFYIRGVEVSLAGLFVGIILYRFGVIPCLVWHYVVDAGYTSMLMVRSGNVYLVVTALAGVGALLVPLAATLVGAWRRGGFVDDPAVLNAADPAPPEPPAAEAPRVAPITAPPLRVALPVAVALAALGALLAWKAPDPGKDVGVRLRPAAVRAAAESYLRTRGVEVPPWRVVVTANQDVLGAPARRYLLEHGGVAQVARSAAEVPLWQVRAFRPEEREEWQLAVDDATGKVVRFQHSLREEAPGATLTVEQGRSKAEAALAAAGFDVSKLEFKEAKDEKRPARMDHTFTWKDPARSVADAEYLLDVTVQGDAVDGVTRRLKLPEAWERARGKATALYYARLAVAFAFIALLVTHGLLAFYRGVRGGMVPWRPVVGGSALLLALFVASLAVTSPLAWVKYVTSMPEALFRVSILIGLAVVTLLIGVLAVLVAGALAACFPAARAAADPAARRAVAGPTAAAALAVLGASLALHGAVGLARGALPTAFSDAPVTLPGAVATVLPAVGSLEEGVILLLLLLAFAGTALHLWLGLGKPWLKALVVAGLLLTVLPVSSGATAPEVVAGFVRAAVTLGLGAVLVRFVLGANPAAYVLGAAWLGVYAAGAPLIAQPGGFYQAQGWTLVVAALALSAWWLLRGPRPGAASTPG